MYLAQETDHDESDNDQDLVEAPEMNIVPDETYGSASRVAVKPDSALTEFHSNIPEDAYIGMYPRKLRWYEQPGRSTVHNSLLDSPRILVLINMQERRFRHYSHSGFVGQRESYCVCHDLRLNVLGRQG